MKAIAQATMAIIPTDTLATPAPLTFGVLDDEGDGLAELVAASVAEAEDELDAVGLEVLLVAEEADVVVAAVRVV